MILSTFLSAVATILHTVINVYIWIIIAAALISWVRPDPYNQIVQLLYRLTEPVYERLRRLVPTIVGGVDLAPIIVLLALQFTDLFFVRLLHEFAASL
ncbi:YggT family protein [uncultured Campylobacter sp.]|jgi:hypothetical protein|uniref:YggT family protein n=1 Tax=uncultured Campylobacter sp. TaxID=218934 RepID=UPI0025FB3A11|nr:YggT family protein [uncultured Campylobacter sp.]